MFQSILVGLILLGAVAFAVVKIYNRFNKQKPQCYDGHCSCNDCDIADLKKEIEERKKL